MVLQCNLVPLQRQDPNGYFSLETLLQLKKEIDNDTLVIFVDLVKAFDLIHHELVFELIKNSESLKD